jgi:hypothetical protein
MAYAVCLGELLIDFAPTVTGTKPASAIAPIERAWHEGAQQLNGRAA